MKLVKPFTPRVIAWSSRKGFTQSICRTKEQKTRLQCVVSAMPKSFGAKKRKDLEVSATTPRLNRFFQQNVQAATVNQWR